MKHCSLTPRRGKPALIMIFFYLHDKALLPRPLAIGFHPFIRGLSASAPRILYASLICSPNLVADIKDLERIQRLATRLVTGMRHLPYEERLQRLGLHSLQRRQHWADLITAFKIFKDIDPNLFFLPPVRSGLGGRPFKVLQGASHRRRRGSAFSVRVVQYWNKLPASVVTAPFVNVFKKRP